MVKIPHPAQDGDASVKTYGLMPAVVDKCEHEVKTAQSGKEYTQLTVDVSVNNDTENGLKKKLFFRMPYDSWAARPGEPVSLFNQFREATGMTAEELSDTKNYKGKGIYVIVGPERKYSGGWNTFEGKKGDTMLSFNIIGVLGSAETKEAVEKQLIETIQAAKKEIEADATPKAAQPGFEEADGLPQF